MKTKLILSAITLGACLVQMNFSSADENSQTTTIDTADVYQDAFAFRQDELTALLNWAAYLSGYETNGINPRLEFRSHQFFVDNACLGHQKCKVVGWYNDKGIVYIDDRLVSLESRFERSLVVHEFVHYLQHISGNFEAGTCEAFVQREREAYATQREFIMAYGVVPTMTFHQHSCSVEVSKETQLAARPAIH